MENDLKALRIVPGLTGTSKVPGLVVSMMGSPYEMSTGQQRGVYNKIEPLKASKSDVLKQSFLTHIYTLY